MRAEQPGSELPWADSLPREIRISQQALLMPTDCLLSPFLTISVPHSWSNALSLCYVLRACTCSALRINECDAFRDSKKLHVCPHASHTTGEPAVTQVVLFTLLIYICPNWRHRTRRCAHYVVSVMSRGTGFLHKYSLELRSELIRFWWPKIKVTVVLVDAMSQEPLQDISLHVHKCWLRVLDGLIRIRDWTDVKCEAVILVLLLFFIVSRFSVTLYFEIQ